ncbi:MAG: DUF1549 domain-containing protein, partial [Chloroflexi bacterium]|nr:DUF1549 domain-containing protein [Chloroflexota bacterium]
TMTLKNTIPVFEGLCLVLLAAAPLLSAPPAPAPKVDYLKQIQPVLRASCYQCHGPDTQAASLRLDQRKAVLGHVVIPGKSASSLLLQRILGQGGKPRMPMGFAPLPSEQVALIRRWIDEGAVWPAQAVDAAHWAYVKPVRPPLPRVRDTSWVRNPIDNFVLSRLEKEGLHPAPEAPKAVLLRRVYLDLTGLPPSVQDVDSFLADRRPDAYERVVDRLLASPQYGERQATPWLDLARYADTNGYEKDSRRTIWPYRDWVVNAFNKDMPFDEFTIEQIAGDMLPNATLDQKIATGFNRDTMYNDEGGVDRKEQTWLTQVDRVGTTASVWLGSTLACAECHDHKYDPFKQKEFYSFLAFFNNSDEPELAVPETGQKGLTTLVMQERTPAVRATAYVRIKGSFLNKGDQVVAGTPAFLPPIPVGHS